MKLLCYFYLDLIGPEAEKYIDIEKSYVAQTNNFWGGTLPICFPFVCVIIDLMLILI